MATYNSPNPGYGSTGWSNDIDDQGVYNAASPNYEYDASGNLIMDNAEGIEAITWDLYGKVEGIARTTSAANAGKKNLHFQYDALGNRTYKQVVSDPYGTAPVTHDTWYIRDPQGNILANYERMIEGDSLVFALTERPIYGSSRIGVNMRRVKLSATFNGVSIDPPNRTMQLTTVMYDSPQSNKDAPEVNTGEYVVLYNVSSDTLNLGAYRLRNVLTNTSWTMSGLGTVAPGQRIMIGNYPEGGASAFKTLSLVTDDQLREGDIRLVGGLGITLPDSAGSIVLEDTAGNVNDRLNYGEYFDLEAANAYVIPADLDTLGMVAPLKTEFRMLFLSL